MKKINSPIVLDNNVLIAWFDHPKSDYGKKLDYLLQTAQEKRQKIIIPTPVMAEFLAHIDSNTARTSFLQQLRRSAAVSIEPFDEPAAIEASEIGKLRPEAGADKPYKQKIKVDAQIVAVAKTHCAILIVSGDKDIRNLGTFAEITVKKIDDLDLPPQDPQLSLLANA